MQNKETSFLELFLTFAKIGSITFGGGYAMLPIIEKELIDKRGWTTYKELMDFYAIAQMTPGVIAVNVATLIGWQRRGFYGAVIATLGLIVPSIVVITIIAAFLSIWMEAGFILKIFAALRICVAALIINAVIPFFKRGITNLFTLLLFILSFLAFLVFGISPAMVVVFCALAGISYDLAKGKLK